MAVIFELSDEEKTWWGDKIREFRDKIVSQPVNYVDRAMVEMSVDLDDLHENINQALYEVRDRGWNLYLNDEGRFHREILTYLMKDRDDPKEILDNLVEEEMVEYYVMDRDEFRGKLENLVGEFSGGIMPYLYQLSLSTTQSRRSRAGNTFEKIIEKFLDLYNYSYDDQASLGKKFYLEQNLSKMVDIVIPGKGFYTVNRNHCLILTMKTTLRERWQEVIEEINRTNMPHVFLLTLDEDITGNLMNKLGSYNITVVTYDWIINDKLDEFDNIKGFDEFFSEEIPHYLGYWNL